MATISLLKSSQAKTLPPRNLDALGSCWVTFALTSAFPDLSQGLFRLRRGIPLISALLFSASFCLAVVSAAGCHARRAQHPSTHVKTLPNGIRLLTVHFPQSTNLAIFSYFPMGLAADGPKQAQWSHLVEHLVIRSTISGNLQKANAETLPDHMRLDFYGDTAELEEAVEHHWQWLQGAPFSQATLEPEKRKVNAEGDYTAKNLATHKFALAAWAQGVRHDQKHAGILEDVDRASFDEIQSYRNVRLTVLTNIVVCVVGGIEPGQVAAVASARLGAIESHAEMPAPGQLHFGDRQMTWDLPARHLVLAWPIPGPETEDYASLMVVAQWLNMQFFWDKDLKESTGLALAGADLQTPEGHFFYVSASLRPGSSFASVQKQMNAHLEALGASDAARPLPPGLGRQLAASLTDLPNLSTLTGGLPPGVTPATVEMNVGLHWGMNQFRYGAQRAGIAVRLSDLKASQIRDAARKHLSRSACSMITLEQAP